MVNAQLNCAREASASPSPRLLLQLQGGQNLGGGLTGTLPMSLPPLTTPAAMGGKWAWGLLTVPFSTGLQIWIEGLVRNPISFLYLNHDGLWAGASHLDIQYLPSSS